MKKTKKISRFDVDFKTRLEQQRTAKNAVRLPKLGYAPYRVYEIKETKGVSKSALNGDYGYRGGGKSFYTKSRQTGSRQWQQVIFDYMSLLDRLDFQQYEVRWLKEKQATVLRLQGHRIEPTTADDESSIGPVMMGA